MDPLGERLNASRLDRRQSVGEHRGEDFDHLPIAVVGAGKLAPHPIEHRRQHPVLERRAVSQSAGLARQNRHVMPGIIDRLAPGRGPLTNIAAGACRAKRAGSPAGFVGPSCCMAHGLHSR